MRMQWRQGLVWFALFVAWMGLHAPALSYGTDHIPIHESLYIGDEHSPTLGALHIIQDKSLLGLRNQASVYYGPVFSLIALPAIGADFSVSFLRGEIHSVQDYKNRIIWDWGGIIIFLRVIAMIAGFLGIIAMYLMLRTKFFNPTQNRLLPAVGALMLGSTFYYFEYASFFRHWIFILVLFLWQLYFLARMFAYRVVPYRFWLYQIALMSAGFGISYVCVILQAIWTPFFVRWLYQRDWENFKRGVVAMGIFLICAMLIVWWHPSAFMRIVEVQASDVSGGRIAPEAAFMDVHGTSFGFYASILWHNNLALIIVWLALLGFAFRQKVYKEAWWWMSAVPLSLYIVAFGFSAHHESRYVLPVILLLLIQSITIAGVYWQQLFNTRIMRSIVLACALFTVAYSAVLLVPWEQMMLNGPTERVAIADVLAYQAQHPQSKTLIITPTFLFGWVHTQDAYRDAVKTFHKEHVPLFQTIVETPPPRDVQPLNAYYYTQLSDTPTLVPRSVWHGYDRIVYQYNNNLDHLQNLDMDFVDSDLSRLWFYKNFTLIFFTFTLPKN